MGQLASAKKQLELVFAEFVELEDCEQDTVLEMTALLLRQMLKDKSGRKQKLTELSSDGLSKISEQNKISSAEKRRNKLARKSSAVSPKAPIKPVQTTKKNELRRK